MRPVTLCPVFYSPSAKSACHTGMLANIRKNIMPKRVDGSAVGIALEGAQ